MEISNNQKLQGELDAMQKRRLLYYTTINTDQLLGFEIRVPVTQKVLEMEPTLRDQWGEDQIRSAGFKPLRFTHTKKFYDGTVSPVAFIIETYVYKREAINRFRASSVLTDQKKG